MKKLLLTLVVGLFCVATYGQRQCGSMDHLHHEIEQNPERAKVLQEIETHTNNWIKNHAGSSTRAVVTIPVVFHVVYRTSTENISDAQLQSQLDVLTDDFRRLNSDADGTWSQAADTEIEFCLASVDPNGNATTGITRTSTTVNGFGTNDAVKFNSSGGKDAWPAADYLNFWVCNIGGGILGYAQFPGGSASTDGVVCDYRYTGTIGTATAPFDLGRTATHEVGHWLNLRHIWGDGPCSADDFVSDTPTSDAPNYGCTPTHVSCSSTDMVQNYMDYSDDACMNLYTLGQKNRMQALFGSGGFRESLLSSNGCGNGNPPPPPPGCDDNLVTVTINFDNYPEETSWQITNSGGSVVASGGTYGSQADGSTLAIEVCFPDGCYDFTINDSYGDGICCGYGNGSYTVTNDGNTMASGGSFGSSETTNFCVGGGGGDPTCSDGIQNGNETGVDCGGPDCDACPTCDDGIQNGNETGVDCGGPDCDACPTCDDGIQNGNETGVDCGGPDCAACPTCDDGVQNGDETGVDCGGSQCAPCGGGGSDVLLAHYFETGWDGWQDGGSDCYRYNGPRSYEGTYSIRIRDNSGTASAMTSPTYDVSSYNSLEIEFYFYPNSMETGEDFWVRYYDGSSWSTVAAYASGTSFTNNSFYVATVTLNAADYNFPSNARFRFQCDASANADRIYIDAVTVTGISSSGARVAQGPTQTIREVKSMAEAKLAYDLDEDGFSTYPNPASNELTVASEDEIQTMKIYSITGRLMAVQQVNSAQAQVDVSMYQPGIYLISIETEEEVLTKKFVKQ